MCVGNVGNVILHATIQFDYIKIENESTRLMLDGKITKMIVFVHYVRK